MSDEFESGFMVNEPSWHKKEKSVLKTSPRTWTAAREEADLNWDVETEKVYHWVSTPGLPEPGWYEKTVGWQHITRDDTKAVLAIQKNTYAVIKNAEFGEVINAVFGLDDDEDPVTFEALMSLYGGRQIVALIRFDNPINMEWDPSKTYRFLCAASRHDGNGGLRGLSTNVRVVCANTHSEAEMTDGKRTGFTIRHTSNWEERLAEVGRTMAIARDEADRWRTFAGELAAWKVKDDDREKWLRGLLPVSDDMTDRKSENVLESRQDIRNILTSATCEHISGNGYGLLMAATEWSDHHRTYQSVDSFVSRQLLHKESFKVSAAKILLSMAKA